MLSAAESPEVIYYIGLERVLDELVSMYIQEMSDK